MRLSIIIIISLAAALAARGAQPMTLRDCLDYAAAHATEVEIASLDSDLAALDSRLASASLMPYLGLSTSGNVSFGRNIDPETNTYDNRRTLSQNFSLQMSLPLFDGLVSINNLRAARARRRGAAASARRTADEIALAAVRAFFNVSYCRAMVGQMEEQLERDSRTLAATERGVELGTKSGADRAELLAIVASDRYELANQQSLLAKAYLQLRAAIGMEPTTEPLEIAADDDITPYAEPSPADPLFINPRILEAQSSLDEGRYNLRAARGALSPSISMSAGISTSYYRMMGSDVVFPDFSRQWSDNMGQYVGLSISIPIFEGLSRVNRIKRAQVELRRRNALFEQTRRDVEREHSEAQLDIVNARKEHEAAALRLEAEEKAYAVAARKYELGSVSAIELFTASTRLATARAALEGKRIQAIIAAITLNYLETGIII